jgi:K+-sensing histidine kinase KdpD
VTRGEWVELPRDDFVESVLRLARDHHIIRIVVGSGPRSRWLGLGRRDRNVDRIVDSAAGAGIDVYVLAEPPNAPAPTGRPGASMSPL